MPTRGWILIAHTHADFREGLSQPEMLEALPDLELGIPIVPVDLHEDERSRDLRHVDWKRWRQRQTRQVRERVMPVLKKHPDYAVAYFGATFIPLAVDLGTALQFRPVHVFQSHHVQPTWSWARAEGVRDSFQVQLEGVESLRDETGEAVIRVSTSYGIRDADVDELVPDRVGDLHVHLGEQIGMDALVSPDELREVVQAFNGAVTQLHQRCTRLTKLHLLICGPVGLAFSIGHAISPTNQPPVALWKFVKGGSPAYRSAFSLGRVKGTSRLGVDTVNKILFLATGPNNQARLAHDQEHREIRERLEASKELIFDLDTRQAVRTQDLQTLLDRTEAPVIHLSGHGAKGGVMYFEGPSRESRPVRRDTLVQLVQLCNRGQIRCVVLNTCHSMELAQALKEAGAVAFTVGMSGKISDGAAVLFADGFYRALADGRGVQAAFDFGRNRIEIEYHFGKEAHIPQLFIADDADPDEVIFL